MAEYDYLFKIVLVGDSQTGKSALLLRFSDDVFSESYIGTIGVDFKIKNMTMESGAKVKLQLWDTSGSERFRSITRAYYRGAQGIILIFDVTDRKSFDNIKNQWVDEAKQNASEGTKMVLVGNKTDLADKREVTFEEASTFAKENDMEFYDVSAKDKTNLDEAFGGFAKTLHESLPAKNARGHKKISLFQQSDDEDDNEDVPLEDEVQVLDEKNATDNDVLVAVGDPCTIVEYVAVIRRQFFELQKLRKQVSKK